MNRIVTIFFLATISLPVNGQGMNPADSLRKAWMVEKNDSLKAWKHLAYIEAILSDGRDAEALSGLARLQNEITDDKYPSLQGWIYFYENRIRFVRYDFINSIITGEKLNRLAAKKPLPDTFRHLIPSALLTTGVSYSKLNDPDNAQLSYQKAIRLLEPIHDSVRLVNAFLNLGYLFTKTQDWASAKNVFSRGLAYLNKEVNEYFSVPLYASLSTAEAKLGHSEMSASYLDEASRLKQKFNNELSNCFYELAAGQLGLLNKQYAAASAAFRKALAYGRQWGDSSSVAESYEGLARAYWLSGDRAGALENLQYSKRIATTQRLIDQEQIVLKTLFDYYKSGGQFREAAGVADSLLLLNDTLAVVLNNNRRIIMNAIFEYEQSAEKIMTLQQQNEMTTLRLKQKNIINIILGGAALFVLFIALLLYRNYRQKQLLHKQRIQELENEKLLLATDAVIKGQEEERSRLAKDLHDGLGGLLSGVKLQLGAMKGNLILSEEQGRTFNNALGKLDESIHEMRRVAHNMMPEALMKFGLQQALQDYCDGLAEGQPFSINCEFYGLENRMDPSTEVVVYRIVQELLNNAVKHAGASVILAQVIRQQDHVTITVEDNGKGFDPDVLLPGTGLKNVRSRVEYLKGQIDIKSEPGKGSSIHIECAITSYG